MKFDRRIVLHRVSITPPGQYKMGLVVIYVIADDIIIQIHLLYIQVLINIQINNFVH